MNKDNWGIKRVCLSCNTRFYDFNKSPILCPACNAVFDPEYLLKRKSKSSQEKNDAVEDIEIDIVEDLVTEAEEDIDEIVEEDSDISAK